MRLSNLLRDSGVIVEIKGKNKTKESLLKEIIGFLEKKDKLDKEEVLGGVLSREEVMSTGLGQGVAIPHTKAKSVNKVMVAFCKIDGGIDFKSLDGEPVYLVFLVVVPDEASTSQIKILARISRLLKHNYIRERLKALKAPEEILEFIKTEEEKHLPL
jgi:fructose-specific phosphotransferase system IIA component